MGISLLYISLFARIISKGGTILQSRRQHSYKGPRILISDLKILNRQHDPQGLGSIKLFQTISPQIRLVTAYMFCCSSLTELFGVERNRQNTTSILLKGINLFVHFISWLSVVGYLDIPFLSALVKVTNIIL